MEAIDWPDVISQLNRVGMTQQQIAAECGCGQSSISELAKGKTTEPRAGLAIRVLLLAQQRGVCLPYRVERHDSKVVGGVPNAA